jgi:hypothetical protein
MSSREQSVKLRVQMDEEERVQFLEKAFLQLRTRNDFY